MAVGIIEADNIPPVAGVRLASVAAGIKKNGRNDMVVFAFDEGVSCAATFTQNAFCAAPVTLAKKHLSAAKKAQLSPRALLINSGNANAGTGETGLQNAAQTCQWLADELQCSAQQILPFSTGVIGQQLPMSVMRSGIKQAVTKLTEDNWLSAARGIMTTDTVMKAATETLMLDGQKVVISGIAKGAGMICPNMATMLCFIATDANVENDFLQQCLSDAVADSFNAITVDGDTSTNDACVLIATAKANNALLNTTSADAGVFADSLSRVCQQLAQAIVRDGEGATKFVTVDIRQAGSGHEAKNVAYTIAHSPLVKTALFASDPNWGRILAAVGRAGLEQLDIGGVNIFLDDVCIVRGGGVDANYREEQGQTVMNRPEITIMVELGRGSESAVIWTTDLSHEYVRINAEYRT
ncbi:MAG: bifunctional glutamate N-acetyltransferase/amino-acid acetyltransferase ArgJ [Gammaproteobacteria bacterium]|jgi:glutamate N-acetyltransferase/amino-acid N-acetyltransferase|nr:bifunctional glutamate N-acetyltransferase/amino-acid acetyltransferase ArgJ [Gammaproteobacteria bacterium]